jgi:hypothetical protein
MRRLLQLGTLFLLLATFLTPLSECFDRWDPPGISNDVEFALFALILTLCLVLLVGKLVSALALVFRFVLISRFRQSDPPMATCGRGAIAFFVPPLSPPPLRI